MLVSRESNVPDNARRKVAFVTGGSSGIGRASVEAFVAQGYAVVVVDRDAAAGEAFCAELARDGHDAAFRACDVTDDAAVERAVEFARERYGRLDAAFNCAGIDGGAGKLLTEDVPENFRQVMAINVGGVWSCMRHQIRVMLEQGGGAIVNASSAAGLVGVPYMSAYTASKHAVVGLTRVAAVEYARQGVRVNAVCPGMVDTPMVRNSLTDEQIAVLNEASPVGRIGLPQEIAATVVWLCGDSAPYLTGQAIAVDGAFSSR
jgi:NAD(P)-dependent dehydrogenase (short-subunit alcohol dehydrogenase family)